VPTPRRIHASLKLFRLHDEGVPYAVLARANEPQPVSKSAMRNYLLSPRAAAERAELTALEAADAKRRAQKAAAALRKSKKRSPQKWSWQKPATECPLPAEWQRIAQEQA
jgi:hypothetical protein